MSSTQFVKLGRHEKGVVFAIYLNNPKEGESVIGEDDYAILK